MVFLERYMCFFTQLNRPIWRKRAYSHLEKHKLLKVFLSQTYSVITGKKVVDAPASNTDVLLLEATCVSSTQMHRPIWNKHSLSPP
jgi:hypothetical protein